MGRIADNQRTITTMERVCAPHISLRTFEVGQDIGERPARDTLLAPEVVVTGVTSDIDHAVQG